MAVVLVGCQPKPAPQVVVKNQSTPGAANTLPPPPPGPDATSPPNVPEAGKTTPPTTKPGASTPTTPDLAAIGKAPEHPMPEKAMTVDPTERNGWAAQSLPDLGKDADRALTQPRDIMGTASVFYEVDGNKLTGRAVIKLRDAKTYAIEYFLPETAQAKNLIKADGKRAFRQENYEWKPVSSALADTDLPTWLKRFAANQFNAVTYGKDGWADVVDRLQKGEAGFTTVTQQKSTKLNGKDYMTYRILATKPDKTEFEAIFDAKQHLPLTVRYNEPGKNGSVNRILWTCKWAGGGQHEAKDFALPATIPNTPTKA
jgi:hypothetical protein